MPNAVWTSTSSDRTVEYLSLETAADGVRADGQVVGLFDEQPLRLRYQLEMDQSWAVQSLRVEVFGGPTLVLKRDHQGHWRDAEGTVLSALAGCADVDVQVTPFTNTLPIRRLGLAVRAARDVQVVYVAVPTLSVRPARQRYTRLGKDRYLFEALEGDFLAELEVDQLGLVVHYAGLFERLSLSDAVSRH